MRRALALAASLTSLWACGGNVFVSPSDGGTDGSSSSSSSGAGSSGGSSSGGSTSSSGGASNSSGGGSSSSSGGGGRVPVNHRPNDVQCSTTPPPGSCNVGGSSSGGPGPGVCSSDAQCADAGANGRCVPFGGGPAGCFCTYDACFHDNDCTGDTCACHGAPYMGGDGNRCVPGNCHVDADCGPGGYCSPTYGTENCGGLSGYYCHTPTDQCVNDSDCAGSGYSVCAYSTTDSRWECQPEVLCE